MRSTRIKEGKKKRTKFQFFTHSGRLKELFAKNKIFHHLILEESNEDDKISTIREQSRFKRFKRL